MSSRKSSTRKTRSQDAKASPSTSSTIKIKVPAPGSTRRPSTPAPSPFSEVDYKKPFHKPSPESFAWPANLVLNSLAYHEYGSFKMDKTTAKSFYVLMHPAIGHLMPLIRRPPHVEAQTPAVLRELLTKALPVFELFFQHQQRFDRSQLLGGVVHRLCDLAAPLGGSLPSHIRALLLRERFKKIGIIPLNFDLPLHGLKPPTDLFIETYPYTADERAAVALFCVEPFVRIFTLLRFPQAVNEDTEARFLPHIACAMESFTLWVNGRQKDVPLAPIQQRLCFSLRKCIENLTQDRQTKRWLKVIPEGGKSNCDLSTLLYVPFPTNGYSLSRTVYPPRPAGHEGPSNVHPMFEGEPDGCCLNAEDLLETDPYVPPIATLPDSSPSAGPLKEKHATEKQTPTRYSRKPRSFSEIPLNLSVPASAPATPTPASTPATPVSAAKPPLFNSPAEELFSPRDDDEVFPSKATVEEMEGQEDIVHGSPLENDVEMPAADKELNIPSSPVPTPKGKGKVVVQREPSKRKRVEDGDQIADPPRSNASAGGKSTAPKVTPVSSPERAPKRPRQTLEVVIQRDPALHAYAIRSNTAAPVSEPNSLSSPSPSPSPGPRTRTRTKIASNKTLKGSKLKKKKSSKRRTASPGFDANFPPPIRPHRGEQKGKQTTKTAREPRRILIRIWWTLSAVACLLCSSSLASPVFASTRSARRGSPGSVASRANLMSAMQTVKRESEDLLLLQTSIIEESAQFDLKL
ncbi:hypothetical protein B0H16DRAFT_1738291 [Mycena metata]|uniref:Uncharacterized protein n=1 Tax=Mycena metata TaxID=1033252 RepID=A0AAD7HIC0_9AGAR|nr:hypothetical protein B0H16DRAFT_1738291 [Mycena metata]